MAGPASGTRRPALRDFQQQIALRLQHAKQAGAHARSAIAVSTTHGHWLFDLAQMAEIIAPPDITPVPLVRPWYLGLIHHRSQLIGVVDLDACAGAPASNWQVNDRLLVLSAALPLHCAIRVSSVHTLLDLSRLRPAMADAGAPHWACERFHDGADPRCWSRVDVRSLLHDPHFIDIGQY